MLPALLVIAGLFGLVLLARLGGAHRRALMRRWPAVFFAGAAMFALARGAIWPAMLLLGASVALWFWAPGRPVQPGNTAPQNAPPADIVSASALLGVPIDASEAQIRAAYRAKMAQAHPDRGGSHRDAAKLTEARDRLLSRRRGG